MQTPLSRSMRWLWLCLVGIVLCLALVLYWVWHDKTRLRWVEDVRLPDGRVVTLTRYQEFMGGHGLGDTPTESDYWFEFKHPATGEVIRWDGKRELATVALMMRGETPVLLVSPNFAGDHQYDCPDPSYLLFQFDKREWRRVALESIPVKRLRSNMTYSPKSLRRHIESLGKRLDADESSRAGARFSLADIDFGLMKEQIFGQPKGCNPPFNYLQSPNPPGY